MAETGIKQKRILGVDLGGRRTGTAVSDPTGSLASGLELIEAENMAELRERIMDLAEKYDVFEIVLGYPVNMNGTIGESAQKVEKFKETLEDLIKQKGLEIAVALSDERLSSALAHVYMNQTGIKSKNRKKKIDMLSAQIILQNYIDRKKNR
ncbi:MAG: Holliday junction resolvase RuvX [Oscillospiraceae bacterium]|nr:Holliday junction resolvase RuvX [Oscillospiraceae bacterium]